ncbi:unnamed protein product [Lupinus luteus]|uniref:Uncharacterized protein n=1 Tax=Lupinus luteus TaxID=3873 RepID=A0AAV1Y4I7_LUPLU
MSKKNSSKTMWSNVFRSAIVCVGSTRWKRASKCKNLIMQFQAQLVNQKNRRHSIIKHSKLDIAQLLQFGNLEHALPRLEQLYKDTCLLDAYNQIENFCKGIITNLSDISICSFVQDLPINVAIAVANLTFTASRCGELSLLHQIRNLFRERYGVEFDFINVELCAGNLVDFELRKNLSINVVPEDEILKLFSEIAQDLNFPLGFKALKQNFNPQFHSDYDGSDQKPEVMNDEMYRDVWSTSPMSYEVGSRRSSSSKDTSPMKGDNQESCSNRTTSEGMNRTPRMSIAYVDDIDEDDKSVNQEKRLGYWD